MIDEICMSKRVVADLRKGPFGPHLDQLGELLEQDHDRQAARRVLLCAGRLATFTAARGGSTSRWCDEDLVTFLLEGAPATADAFYARDVRRVLGAMGLFDVDGPVAWQLRLLTDYDEHLRDVRGITEGVRLGQADVVRLVLAFHRRRHGADGLESITGQDVLALFQEAGERYQRVATTQKFAGFLRQTLRFLRLRGHVEKDLAGTVPLFINYRLSTVPNHLAWADVRRLVAAIDLDIDSEVSPTSRPAPEIFFGSSRSSVGGVWSCSSFRDLRMELSVPIVIDRYERLVAGGRSRTWNYELISIDSSLSWGRPWEGTHGPGAWGDS